MTLPHGPSIAAKAIAQSPSRQTICSPAAASIEWRPSSPSVSMSLWSTTAPTVSGAAGPTQVVVWRASGSGSSMLHNGRLRAHTQVPCASGGRDHRGLRPRHGGQPRRADRCFDAAELRLGRRLHVRRPDGPYLCHVVGGPVLPPDVGSFAAIAPMISVRAAGMMAGPHPCVDGKTGKEASPGRLSCGGTGTSGLNVAVALGTGTGREKRSTQLPFS